MFPIYFIVVSIVTFLWLTFLIRTLSLGQVRTNISQEYKQKKVVLPIIALILYISLIISEVIYAYILTLQDTAGILTQWYTPRIIIIWFCLSVVLKSTMAKTYLQHISNTTIPEKPTFLRKHVKNDAIHSTLLTVSILLCSLYEVFAILTLVYVFNLLS